MPLDRFSRQIDYLRLSVIDHCNLRCVYCMPLRGLTFVPAPELLTAAEIETVARAAVGVGFRKFRLTGGEPTLRADIVEIASRIAGVPGVEDLAMTTNGILLPRLAKPLREAGLRRLNIHVDTLHPERLKKLMRFASVEEVEAGIAAAEEAGLVPIKLNCTVTRDYNDGDVVDLARRRQGRRLARPLHRAHAPRRRGDRPRRALAVRAVGRDPPADRGRARPARACPERPPLGRGPQLPLRGQPGDRRLHLAGERALLRRLQPHAADRGREVPPLPAERRRARREAGARAGGGIAEVERILLRAVALKPTGHRLDEGLSTRDRSMFQIGG